MATIDIIRALDPGMEVKLLADPAVLQTAKFGLIAFALLCTALALYILASQFGLFGLVKRGIFAWVGFGLAALAAFLLYQKALNYQALDDHAPILTINARELEYDVRSHGWHVVWSDIAQITVHEEVRQKKQSVAEKTREIRVILKQSAMVEWKDIQPETVESKAAKSLYENRHYLVINPEPLGLDHEDLAEALERYRQEI